MIRYVIKRILIFIPTLIAISLISFFINQAAPGDPFGCTEESERAIHPEALEKACAEDRKAHGLHLPAFYFSFSSLATPDTLYRVYQEERQNALRRLLDLYGNWEAIENYHTHCRSFYYACNKVQSQPNTAADLIKLNRLSYAMLRAHDPANIASLQSQTDSILSTNQALALLQPTFKQIDQSYQTMQKDATAWKNYFPWVHVYGFNNQYHRWFTRLIGFNEYSGISMNGHFPFLHVRWVPDFGKSYADGRPVWSVISDAVGWTFLISMLSMISIFCVAIPLGILAAVNNGRAWDRTISIFLFLLYSLPTFWIATLLIMFFGGGDYLDWFPTFGITSVDESAAWWVKVGDTAYHLVLPLICFIYPGLAFLSRQVRGAMVHVFQQDFIRTAQAKGLPQKQIVLKHAFRNSLLPLITIFAYVLPMAISGSVILENVFSIPGMGMLSFEAISDRNFPIIQAVVILSSFLTIAGFLLADVLYAVADPRIVYDKRSGK